MTDRQTDKPADAAMTVTSLRFGYEPGSAVVRDVTAALAPGRLCCLIGPNAAGKTTLLRLMLGQLEPWAGEVQLDGRPVHALDPRERARRVSYVPQRGAVAFAFTVREVVGMGRYASGGAPPSRERRPARLDAATAVDTALAACDLEEIAHRPFVNLSGGQQQRVLIARAMAQAHGSGRVMLLDEPGSHLDLWHLHQLMRLLREQAAAGMAVLVVLHDLALAARYADDVWLMHGGALAAAGPWQTVLQPAILEPVYRVALRPLHADGADRPVFHIEPADTLYEAPAPPAVDAQVETGRSAKARQ